MNILILVSKMLVEIIVSHIYTDEKQVQCDCAYS